MLHRRQIMPIMDISSPPLVRLRRRLFWLTQAPNRYILMLVNQKEHTMTKDFDQDDNPLVSKFDKTVDDLSETPKIIALKKQLAQVELEIQNLLNQGANIVSFSKYFKQ